MKRLLLITIATIMMTGCGIHQNVLTPIANSPEVIMRENNFKVIGTAKATTSTLKVLGVGGLSRKAVRNNAIAMMIENANLQGSQTIVNITERYAITGFYPIASRIVVTVMGTIIEFTDNVNININNGSLAGVNSGSSSSTLELVQTNTVGPASTPSQQHAQVVKNDNKVDAYVVEPSKVTAEAEAIATLATLDKKIDTASNRSDITNLQTALGEIQRIYYYDKPFQSKEFEEMMRNTAAKLRVRKKQL